MEWYQKLPATIAREFETNMDSGLSSEEAQKRIERLGPNRLEESKKKPLSEKIIEQFKDPLVIILIVAALLSMFTGDKVESLLIIAIVALNAMLSIYQEGKAEDAVAALQKMSSPNAQVIRGGKVISIKSDQLVPGDLVILETGAIVPADLRLISSSNLQIDESSFTGESVAVEKDAEAVYNKIRGIGDRANYAYSSTIVTYGHGRGLVTATGKDTEIGKIATTIQSYEQDPTPLQKKLAVFSKQLGKLIIGVSIVVAILGLIAGNEFMEIVMTAISLAVAAIPEGMTAVVTIVLAIGMNRMAQRHAIVKKLLSVETLGTTTVICSDKTGTLTQNEMTVTKIFNSGKVYEVSGTGYAANGEISFEGKPISASEDKNLRTMLMIAVSDNDAKISEEDGVYSCLGDPTEGALLTMASKAGLDPERMHAELPRLDEIPFDSIRKMMTTFNANFFEGKIASFTKGAPDIIIANCDYALIDGEIVEFSMELKDRALDINNEFARSALRCLAYGYKLWDELPEKKAMSSENVERGMIFAGLTGMIDPPRPEVKDAIAKTKSAGITTLMITGDYLETALAIGRELGIAESYEQTIMGAQLNGKSLEEMQQIVREKKIFARVSPENKVQIVDALKANGEIVAMTGDGVNDAPAIKKADIGISMGITGTDVAKNTAEVILTDDNFATIVAAVEEGRIIFANIKKFINFLLSCNVGEVLVIAVAMIIDILMIAAGSPNSFPVPLSPIMLLWLNLVTDSFPALALGMEPGEPDIMKHRPRNPNEPIIDKDMLHSIIVQAVAIAAVTLGAFALGYYYFGKGTDPEQMLAQGRTLAFATLILAELFRAMAARSNRYPLKQIGWFTNKYIIASIFIGAALLLLVIYIPIMRNLFDIAFMGPKEWLPVLILSIVPFAAAEVYESFTTHED